MPHAMATTSPSEKKQFASDIARAGWMVIAAKIIRHGLVGATYFLLVNILLPADFGLLKMMTAVLGAVNLVSDFGFSVAVVQKHDLDENNLGGATLVSMLFGLALYALLFLSAPVVAWYFKQPSLVLLLRVGSISVPLGALSAVHRGLLQRHLSFGRLALAEIVGGIVSSIIAMIGALNGWGVWALVAQIVTQTSIASFAIIILVPAAWSGIRNIRIALPLMVFGFSVVLPRIIDFIGSNLDTILIGRLLGNKVLGLYGVAFWMVTLPQLVIGAVAIQLTLSVFSRLQKDHEALNRTFVKLNTFIVILVCPFFIVLALFTPEITSLMDYKRLQNPQWLGSVSYMRFLIPLGFLYVLSNFSMVFWIAKGMMRERFWWVLANFLSLGLFIIVGTPFGVSGICISLSIRAFLTFFVFLLVTRHYTNLSIGFFIGQILPPIAVSFCTIVPLWLLKKGINYFITGHRYGLLGVEVLVTIALYAVILKILFPKAMQDSLDFCRIFLKPIADKWGVFSKIKIIRKP